MKINNFIYEVYLEGYLVPGVVGFNISESSNNLPAASVSIAGTGHSLKILADTIIQIFGNKEEDNLIKNEENFKSIYSNNQLYLLYEGKITSIRYGYSAEQGSMIYLNSISILSEFYNTKLRPADAIVTVDKEKNSTVENFHNSIIVAPQLSTPRSKNSVDINSSNNTDEALFKEIDDRSGLNTILTSNALNFAQVLSKNTAGSVGNFFPFFNKMNDLFAQSDILYAINSKSLNIFDSIFVFPNPNLSKFFQISVVLEALKTNNSNISVKLGQEEINPISSYFEIFKQYLYYRQITPAAPTASNLFYSRFKDLADNDVNPIREYYIPGIESGPPIKSNIIFPEQIVDIQYSNDMLNELTRLILNGAINITGKGDSFPFSPNVVAPNLEIFEEKESKTIYTGYTDEEFYRGVHLRQATINAVLNKILVDKLGVDKDDDGKLDYSLPKVVKHFKNDDNSITTTLGITAGRQYITEKFATKRLEVTTAWSPNYVVGLPGMVFKEGMPTFIGTVSSVNHSISLQGSAITSVVFTSCRIIHDEKVDTEEQENLNPLSDFLLNDVTENIIYGGVKYMYDENLYSFDNIGKFLYNYIITGKINKTLLSTTIDLNNDLWKEFSSINDKYSGDTIDYSILSFIKDENGDIFKKIKTSWEDYIKHKKFLPEERNGFYLKEAIRLFKRIYKELVKKSTELDSLSTMFMNDTINRNLVKKEDYLKFIKAANPDKFGKVDLNDVKDLQYIVKNNFKRDLQWFKVYINKIAIPEYDLTKTELSFKKTIGSKESLKKDIDKYNKELKKLENELAEFRKKLYFQEGSIIKYINGIPISESKINKKVDTITNRIKAVKKLIDRKTKSLKQLDRLDIVYNAKTTNNTNEIQDTLSLFKPYNATRKAHVVESFKDFKSFLDGTENKGLVIRD